MRTRSLKMPKLSRWIIASVCAHICLVVAYLVLTEFGWDSSHDQQVVQVHIVQLGKKRDETLLPRIVPQDENVEAPTKVDEPNPPPLPEPTPEPKSEPQKHVIEQTKPPEKKKPPSSNVNPLEALKRRVKELEKEGNPEGAARGNSVMGDLKEGYKALVQALLKDNFDLPATISDREKQTLKLLINIKIAENGKPISVKIISRSRNSDYDDAVLGRVKQISSFGAPPLPLRKTVQRDGLEFAMCPLTCP